MEPWSLFPGVYSEVVDSSFGVQASAGSTGFVCLMSQKGPDNQLMLHGEVTDILKTYGNVDVTSYGQGMKIAIQYLRFSNQLYALRVTPDHTNCSAMSTIYKDLYGSYTKSAIDMREAAYANIGIATNENGEFELVYVGPEDLGNILSLETSVAPTEPKLNDRYFIPLDEDPVGNDNQIGDWGEKDSSGNYIHKGDIAICTAINPVIQWKFKEINDTSVATVNNVDMCAAVVYDVLEETEDLWRDYENTYNSPGTYISVKDIIYELPSDPEDEDSYLVASNHTDINLSGHENQVATYSEILGEWEFNTYQKVFIDKDMEFTNEPESYSEGDSFIIGYSPKITEWKGNQQMFAKYINGSWKILKFEVARPEETEKFRSLVINRIDDDITTTRIEFTRKNVIIKDIIWTSDINASFCAYAHRTAQFQDIVDSANPDNSIKSDDNPDGSIEPFVMIYPIGRGSYYNGIRVNMSLSKKSQVESEDSDKILILDVYSTDDGNILKVESFQVSFNPNKKDLNGNSLYIEDVVNTYSNYIRVATNRENFNENALFVQNIHTNVDQLFTRYILKNSVGSTKLAPALKHGDDGNIFDKYGNLNWDVATSLLVKAYTGQIINPAAKDTSNAYETRVLDRERVLFDLVFDAGYPGDVKVAILTLIESRHNDCVGIIDLGDNASASAAYTARTEGIGVSFNNPYIAIYEPYSRVYDEYSGRDIWISPVYHAARAIALTDLNYGRHHAPAGVKRGICPEVKELRYNLNMDTAWQDLFVTYNINPIIQNRDGYVIWGQSTSQLRASKMQDLNVVRLVVRIKRDLEFTLRDYLFDLNDQMTWTLMSSAVNAYLGNLVSEGALTSYSTQVYASDYDITQHRVRVDVMLEPKQVIYQILLTITV